MHQSKLVSEPLAVLDQGLGQCEPETSHRQLEQSNALKGGLTSQVRRPLHSGFSLARPHGRYEYATSRAGSEGGVKAENEVFLLV